MTSHQTLSSATYSLIIIFLSPIKRPYTIPREYRSAGEVVNKCGFKISANNSLYLENCIRYACGQWLKLSCEAGGVTRQSQVGADHIPIPHPTNLALFWHKIIQSGGLILLQGAQIGAGARGGGNPPHFNHCLWLLYTLTGSYR